MKRSRIQQKLCKLMQKERIAIRSSKHEQPVYNFLKNIDFTFLPQCFLSKMHQEIEFLRQNYNSSVDENNVIQKKKDISLEFFLNYDIIFYTFQDIKDYLKNLSTGKSSFI